MLYSSAGDNENTQELIVSCSRMTVTNEEGLEREIQGGNVTDDDPTDIFYRSEK